MKKYISFIEESEQDNFEFMDGANEHLIVGAISTINILVGANNSRKSRFMRMLLKKSDIQMIDEKLKEAFFKGLECFDSLISEIGGNELINVNVANGSSTGWLADFDNYETTNEQDRYNLFITSLRRTEADRLILDKEALQALKGQFIELLNKKEHIQRTNNGVHTKQIADFFGLLHNNRHKNLCCGAAPTRLAFNLIADFHDKFLELKEYFLIIPKDTSSTPEIRRIFIPSLRGSLPLYNEDYINAPLYERTTNELYFTDKNQHDGKKIKSLAKSAEVYAGDDLYDKILTDRNSNKAQRLKFEEFQNFVSNSFFNGKAVEVVATPKSTSQKISVYIQGEEERELKDLGDGIQHLLILLYPIFMAEGGTWIFIDEPELCLHPGFQNLFLETILNNPELKAKNLCYFMTTHSNHFLSHALRAQEEVSVFSFSQFDKDRSMIQCVHGADTTLLDQLGVENASVYMANCSIWVEGVSDRRYLQAFLKAYCAQENDEGKKPYPELKEGLDYAFFEYAGTNLVHYLFDPDKDDPDLIDSFKNANRIFLLADQDKGKDKKHETLSALNSERFEYHTTGTREVENILPPPIFEDFLKSYPSQKEESFSATQQDYADKPMGRFLREHIGDNALKFGDKTLETRYKNDLSELVLSSDYRWADLATSSEIERITTAIYKFIRSHNKITSDFETKANDHER